MFKYFGGGVIFRVSPLTKDSIGIK